MYTYAYTSLCLFQLLFNCLKRLEMQRHVNRMSQNCDNKKIIMKNKPKKEKNDKNSQKIYMYCK